MPTWTSRRREPRGGQHAARGLGHAGCCQRTCTQAVPAAGSWWPSRGSNERRSQTGFWNGDRGVPGSLLFEPQGPLHLLLSAGHRGPPPSIACVSTRASCSRWRGSYLCSSSKGPAAGDTGRMPLLGTVPRWARDTRTTRLARVSEPTVPAAGAGSASPKPQRGAFSKCGRVGRCSETSSARCPPRRAARSTVLGCSAPAASPRHGLCCGPFGAAVQDCVLLSGSEPSTLGFVVILLDFL